MGNKLQFLPLLCFILFPTTFIITYSIALSYDHINPFFSYISDTGTLSPEMCWFSLLLTLTSIVLGSVVYIRYKQVEEYFRVKKSTWIPRINVLAFIIGLISALGGIVVGCFQETNILSVHVAGAFMAFLGGSIYFIFQAYFTFKMLPMFTNRTIAIMRMFIGVTCVILFTLTYTCGVLSFNGFQGNNALKWDRSEKNWYLRTVSVSCEWIMATLFDIGILTFVLDFRKISFKAPQFKLVEMVEVRKTGEPGERKFIPVRYHETNIDKD